MSNVIRSLIVKVGADTSQFSTAMKNVSKDLGGISKNLTKTGQSLSKAGANLTKSVTVPIAGIGTASVSAAFNFEAQMSRVQAISEATGEELEQLNKQALDLGAKTKFGATEAAEGMEQLASAGFNTKEIMAAMPGLLDLAASSGEELAVASDIAASTLRGFGLDASKAGHVADVLAKNASKTNAAVYDTGEAMKYIAPAAKAMDMELEEVTAAIGIMADSGIKGSQAGTTLRGALTRLVKPTKQMYGVIDKLGLSFFDTSGNMLDMEGILRELEEGTTGLTQEQKNQALATLFGQEALSGMLALVDAGPDRLKALTDEYKNADGAAAAMAETMMNNGKGSIEQMMGSLETAGIKIGQALTPHIIKAADAIGKLADKFSAMSPEQQEMIIKMAATAAAMGPVLSLAGNITKGFGGIFDTASKVTGAVGKFNKALDGGSTILGALGTMLGPGGAVILGLAAVATAAVLIYKNWDKITAAVKGAIDAVKNFLGLDGKKAEVKVGTAVTGSSGDKWVSPRWNAEGGIFTKPTVLPTIAGWQGFGEAGAEAILPLSKLENMLKNGEGSNPVKNEYNIQINNPKPEKSSDSVRRTLMKQSYGIS
jgi:TP901 family phage tail tape measure protein